MLTLDVQNVNAAWADGARYVLANGSKLETRNGPASVLRSPLTTTYRNPCERVLLDPVRDQNCIFTLMEGLWMWAGRDDAVWLDQFVSDFSSRYAEEDGRQHGAYGRRWRDWFINNKDWRPEQGFRDESLDQIHEVVKLLKANPQDRQAVIQMWDPSADLGVVVKDKPCNSLMYLRTDFGALDLTVCCRSNDACFGAWGANAVHFSMAQEILAAYIGVPVGVYHQVSNNIHMYDSTLDKWDADSARRTAERPYPGWLPMVEDLDAFEDELHAFLDNPESVDDYKNSFFEHTARPMWLANAFRREKRYEHALIAAGKIRAPDWRAATVAWLQRRVAVKTNPTPPEEGFVSAHN